MVFQQDSSGGKGAGKVKPQEGLVWWKTPPGSLQLESHIIIRFVDTESHTQMLAAQHILFFAASEGNLNRGSPISYNYSPFLRWSHPLHNSLTLTLPSSSGFFLLGYETQWKTHNHNSCLPLLALTEIIYTPAYWNFEEREKEREMGEGGRDSVYSCRFA